MSDYGYIGEDSSRSISVRPRGVLLDFGSVITLSVFERRRQIEERLELPVGTLKWQGPIAPETDPLWQSMLRDEISERDYWARRAHEIGSLVSGSGWSMRELLTQAREANPKEAVRPQMRDLVTDCRAHGIKTGILSNEMELFYGNAFLAGMEMLEHMDVIVDASNTGILKPDPRSYARGIEAMGLGAQEILFVDDQFRNIAGAVKVGLQTHHFDLRDVTGSIAAIRARLRLPV